MPTGQSKPSYDVAIIGLGVMGSAAAWQLSRRGAKVLGLEQFTAAHARGSSHGLSRVIRQAYFEHPSYVPLVLRAYALWEELERETQRVFFHRNVSALMIGQPGSPIVRGSLDSARLHGLPYRQLDNAELRARFPFMLFSDDEMAIEEPDAGVLLAEDAVLALQQAAMARGADLRFGVEAEMDAHYAPKTIVTAGPWVSSWAPELPVRVERQVLFWFAVAAAEASIPLCIWDRGARPFYVVPNVAGHGVKVAFHHGGEITTAPALRRAVEPIEIADMRAWLAQTIPALDRPPSRTAVCVYTNMPDGHFAVGPMPLRPDVIIASPCSGHGFKFAPVVGEILADLALGGHTRHDIDLFRLDRSASGPV